MSGCRIIVLIGIIIVHVVGFIAAYFAAKEIPGWTGAEICCLAWCACSLMWAITSLIPEK